MLAVLVLEVLLFIYVVLVLVFGSFGSVNVSVGSVGNVSVDVGSVGVGFGVCVDSVVVVL